MWNKKYLFWGTFFGVFNEVFYAPLWDYSELLGPQIYEIPVIAPFGWGLVIMLILSLSDIIREVSSYRKIMGIALFSMPTLLLDVTLITVLMAPCEYILSRAGFWEYRYWLHENPIGMIAGYIFASIIISRLCRK